MHTSLRHGVLVLALLGSVSVVAAQDKASEVGQNPAAQTSSGATPPSNSGALNNPQMQGHNAGPWETTGSAKDGGPAASNSGGTMEPGGPPGATGQTMPSTRSSQNAAEDKRIIVEHALNLGDEQKQKIAQLMAPQMSATSGSGSSESLTVGNTLPASVTMHEFPPSVTEQISEMQKYKYVQMSDKLLIVEPNNRIVVGIVSR